MKKGVLLLGFVTWVAWVQNASESCIVEGTSPQLVIQVSPHSEAPMDVQITNLRIEVEPGPDSARLRVAGRRPLRFEGTADARDLSFTLRRSLRLAGGVLITAPGTAVLAPRTNAGGLEADLGFAHDVLERSPKPVRVLGLAMPCDALALARD